MGKRDLYPMHSTKTEKKLRRSYMHFLQYADGSNSLEKISNLINLNYKDTKKIYSILKNNSLIL